MLTKKLRSQSIISNLITYSMWLLAKTVRVRVELHPDYNDNTPYLFAFWHGKQWLPVIQLRQHKTKNCALVSPSQDGDILTKLLNRLNYEVIRGSSRDNNVRALVMLIKKLKEGASVGFGVDGPIGPIYKVKPGMTYLSQKCQIPIVPLGSCFKRKWEFSKAWDRFQLPKPFTIASYYVGKPILVPKAVDLKQQNLILQQELQSAELRAMQLLS